MQSTGYLFDYYGLWTFGRLTLLGDNAYDQIQIRLLLSSLDIDFQDPLSGHLPCSLWLYALFATIPFELSRIVWFFFIGTLLFFYCSESVNYLIRNRATVAFNHLLIFILSFSPVINNLRWGQSNAVIALGLVGYLTNSERSNARTAGLALSFTTWKPHLFLPLYAYIFAESFRKKDFKVIGWLVVGVLVQVIMTGILSPQTVLAYPNEFLRSVSVTSNFSMPSLALILSSIFASPALRIAIPLCGIVFGFTYALRKNYSLRQDIGLLLSLSALVSPYCWSHTFLILLLPYISSVLYFIKRFGNKIIPLVALLGMMQFYLELFPHSELYFVFIPISLTLIHVLIPLHEHNRRLE